jgi:cupin 2 domain-containing protein
MKNIFSNIPTNLIDETFQDILVRDNLKIERIVSRRHASPEGSWYDQNSNEWVILPSLLRNKGGNSIWIKNKPTCKLA